MKAVKFAIAVATFLAIAPAFVSAQTIRPRVFTPGEPAQDPPAVDVWIDSDMYNHGEPIRAGFTSEPGAYITILRVTTDGELRVMYPSSPRTQRQYEQEEQIVSYSTARNGAPIYYAYESRGTGFVFAIASYERFDYSYFAQGGAWNVARLANMGRHGDPFEIVRVFVDQTLGRDIDVGLDYVAYEVEARSIGSRYATRYHYDSFDDVYDRCLSAFGYFYNRYCGTYNNGSYGGVYYGPFIVAGPRTPIPNAPRSPREPAIKPLVPDPMLPTPAGNALPQRTEGRFPATVSSEAAAAARRERMLRDVSPRTEMKSTGEVYARARRSEPQVNETTLPNRHPIDRSSEPRIYREPATQPVQRSEPVQRSQPVMRAEPQRSEPRVMQAAPAPRAEPRAEPRSVPAQRSDPSPAKAKDQQQ